MELGATVCLPGKPQCRVCPVCSLCRARVSGTVLELPVKLRKTEPVRIAGALLLVRKGRRILLRQREGGARRMAGFWDLPAPEDLPGARSGARFGEFRHTITHHHYTFTVLAATPRRPPGPASPQFRWFRPAALTQIPLSTTARKALKLAGIL
jgi:A/G-specific adenine glycosylase